MNSPGQIPNLEVRIYNSGKHVMKSLEGTIDLPAWSGFPSRQGNYNAVNGNKCSDGRVKLTVGEIGSSVDETILPEQVNAYNFILEHQDKIRDKILDALLLQYKRLRKEYGYDEEDDQTMPEVIKPAQLKNLIGLSTIHILEFSKDEVAYIGYEFGCNWDEEHGLGVMTHKDRVIEIGGADTSFDTWLAEKDIDPVQAGKELERYKGMRGTVAQKPWWKFW